MVKLSTMIIGFIVLTATALSLFTFVSAVTSGYNITEEQLFADNNTQCSAYNITVDIHRMFGQIQNTSIDSASHAPGQTDMQVSSTITASTQQSGLVTTLKFIPNLLTLSGHLLDQLSCYMGLTPELTLAIRIVLIIAVLLLIAGLFYYRPI